MSSLDQENGLLSADKLISLQKQLCTVAKHITIALFVFHFLFLSLSPVMLVLEDFHLDHHILLFFVLNLAQVFVYVFVYLKQVRAFFLNMMFSYTLPLVLGSPV